MDISSLLPVIITFLGNLPYVGPVIAVVLGLVLPLAAIVSALVLVWQAVIKLIQALSVVIPGLKGAADWLKLEDAVVGTWVATIQKWLTTLSVIPIPKLPAPPKA